MKRVLLLLLLMSSAIAGDCNTILLGVSETPQGYKGVTANLTVIIKPGDGSVWVDTMPLTKLETQISARLARNVACDLTGIDCSKLDFYYKIRSSGPMVGGPSAGATMTVCSLSALLNKQLNNSVAMTGTISPDGSVGPVGLISVKSEPVKDYDLLIIPFGEQANTTIRTVSVSNIIDAFYIYSGYNISLANKTVRVTEDYTNLMKKMSESLISRAEAVVSGNVSPLLLNKSLDLFNNGSYYSSASYAVQSLIYSFYDKNDTSINSLIDEAGKLRREIKNLTLNHLYDIEGLAITINRLNEAEDLINKSLKTNSTDSLFYKAYAKTRLITVKEWMTVLDYFNGTSDYELNNDLSLEAVQRIELARNSIAYARIMMNDSALESAEEHLINAVNAYNNNETIYSLFESMKAKAEADLMIELLNNANLTQRVKLMNESAVRAISYSMSKGYLPLLSLSYYEYAGSFDDVYQKLIFLSYSKEFASLSQLLVLKKNEPDYFLIISLIILVLLAYFLIPKNFK